MISKIKIVGTVFCLKYFLFNSIVHDQGILFQDAKLFVSVIKVWIVWLRFAVK